MGSWGDHCDVVVEVLAGPDWFEADGDDAPDVEEVSIMVEGTWFEGDDPSSFSSGIGAPDPAEFREKRRWVQSIDGRAPTEAEESKWLARSYQLRPEECDELQLDASDAARSILDGAREWAEGFEENHHHQQRKREP